MVAASEPLTGSAGLKAAVTWFPHVHVPGPKTGVVTCT